MTPQPDTTYVPDGFPPAPVIDGVRYYYPKSGPRENGDCSIDQSGYVARGGGVTETKTIEEYNGMKNNGGYQIIRPLPAPEPVQADPLANADRLGLEEVIRVGDILHGVARQDSKTRIVDGGSGSFWVGRTVKELGEDEEVCDGAYVTRPNPSKSSNGSNSPDGSSGPEKPEYPSPELIAKGVPKEAVRVRSGYAGKGDWLGYDFNGEPHAVAVNAFAGSTILSIEARGYTVWRIPANPATVEAGERRDVLADLVQWRDSCGKIEINAAIVNKLNAAISRIEADAKTIAEQGREIERVNRERDRLLEFATIIMPVHRPEGEPPHAGENYDADTARFYVQLFRKNQERADKTANELRHSEFYRAEFIKWANANGATHNPWSNWGDILVGLNHRFGQLNPLATLPPACQHRVGSAVVVGCFETFTTEGV